MRTDNQWSILSSYCRLHALLSSLTRLPCTHIFSPKAILTSLIPVTTDTTHPSNNTLTTSNLREVLQLLVDSLVLTNRSLYGFVVHLINVAVIC